MLSSVRCDIVCHHLLLLSRLKSPCFAAVQSHSSCVIPRWARGTATPPPCSQAYPHARAGSKRLNPASAETACATLEPNDSKLTRKDSVTGSCHPHRAELTHEHTGYTDAWIIRSTVRKTRVSVGDGWWCCGEGKGCIVVCFLEAFSYTIGCIPKILA